MTPEDEKEIHEAMMDSMKEFAKENQLREQKPEKIELYCAICAVLLIVIFTAAAAPVWAAPFALLPPIGRTTITTLLDFLRK